MLLILMHVSTAVLVQVFAHQRLSLLSKLDLPYNDKAVVSDATALLFMGYCVRYSVAELGENKPFRNIC